MSSAIENQAMIAHFAIKVDGTNAAERVYSDLLEIVVESTLNMPDMATIKIHDAEFHWIDDSLFTEGKKIEIEASNQEGQLESIFKGEIVGIEMDLSAIGTPSVTVRCFDKSHRLHRGRKARSFLNVTDSDLAKKLAEEAGLKVSADATSAVHDWVLQNNQTNWEFLVERAAMNGFRIYCADGDVLYFEKIDKAKSAPEVELGWGEALRSFRLRTNTHTQVNQVEVRAWDCLQKDTIVASARLPKIVPEIGHNDGPGKARSAFGEAKMVVVDRPFPDKAQAQVYADSVCDDMGGTFVEAEGLCYGHPSIRSGTRIKIANIGTRFSGKYYVTSATHTYTPGEGFSTVFVVSGKRTQTLLGLVDREDLAKRRSIGSNPVIGIVTNNDDPENLGRVKVKYPWLTDEHESYWARHASQMAGVDRGMYSTPEVNDEVVVIFEHGDITRPIIIGMLWSRKDTEPANSSVTTTSAIDSGRVNRRGFRTRKGHLLEFDDTDGKEQIMLHSNARNGVALIDHGSEYEGVFICSKTDFMILLQEQKKRAIIQTPAGLELILDDSSSEITVKTKSGQKLLLKESGEVTLDANSSITLSAINITLDAKAVLNLKAPNINVDGTALVKIQAPMVNIN